MNDLTNLERRLASILESATAERSREGELREAEMRLLEPRRDRFESIAGAWISDVVVPRLRALARAFREAGEVDRGSGGLSASLKFAWTEDSPVGASLTVSIAPDAGFERATLHVQPQLIPMLAGHPEQTSRDFDFGADDQKSLEDFLDDGIVAFAEAYQRVGEPNSLYQRGSLVTDPVCGMTIHRKEAADSFEYETRRYYFCAPSCAESFRAAPDRYVRPIAGKAGPS